MRNQDLAYNLNCQRLCLATNPSLEDQAINTAPQIPAQSEVLQETA
jgi:hypothetical protein